MTDLSLVQHRTVFVISFWTFFQITELLPGILNQLGAESLTHLKKLASNVSAGDSAGDKDEDDEDKKKPEDKEEEYDDDDDVPDLVENFDEASKGEAIVQGEETM